MGKVWKCFDTMHGVVFVASLDIWLEDTYNREQRIADTFYSFESLLHTCKFMITSSDKYDIHLLLNKFDVFTYALDGHTADKLESIKNGFKTRFNNVLQNRGHKIHTYLTNATDPTNLMTVWDNMLDNVCCAENVVLRDFQF